jgi:hypothetical protein|tara:strand:+ start:1268 stop:1828 length:561 start_codon:yes stop_codon:yes gene_type:complete
MSIIKEAHMSINVKDNDIASLSSKCKQLQSIRGDIDELEAKLKQMKNDEERISTEEIPALLTSLGMRDFTLEDGSYVGLKTNYFARISKANEDAAYGWLRANGHGDLIRNEIAVPFTKGQDEKAKLLEEMIKSKPQLQDIVINKKQSVNAMQLKAFVKEQVQKGVDIPDHLLGAYVQTQTVIKEEK